MLDRIGLSGLAGLAVALAGVVVLATVDLRVAAGVALVVAGMGLLANGLVKSVLRSFGMA